MSEITSYTTLVAALDGADGWLHRDDQTARIPQFIALAEDDMQMRLKLLEFEGTASIAVTDGVGDLPADFLGMRSIYWSGNPTVALSYISPDRFDAQRNSSGGYPAEYTISGTTIRVTEGATGTAVATYNARFMPLSAGNDTNALITNYPTVYLYGTLAQYARYAHDYDAEANWMRLYELAVDRAKGADQARRHAGPLTVRAR